MPSKLTWTLQARRDVLDIYELIGLEQPAAAERYFDRTEALAGLLCDQPRMGVARPDIASGLRMLVERPYVLLYRIEPDQPIGPVDLVEIVRVVDGRRDLKGLF
ncbi:MAG: type II toxin-antitoxin system RelE/ParE family toxin [Burkholderiales bacterium]|nr:type II toxin-antitoxin system RelE/ParE family toxin [Burkholderiales bacterium]